MMVKPDWDREGRDWPNRAASRFVQASGLRWHVQVMGEGPTVLMLHGSGAATHSWRDLAPLLAAADRLGAVPVTTPKDFVRLPPNVSDKIHAIGVDLIWDDAHAIAALLEEIAAR